MGRTPPADWPALFNPFGGGLVHVNLFTTTEPSMLFQKGVITTLDAQGQGPLLQAMNAPNLGSLNLTAATANRARLGPIFIVDTVTIDRIFWFNHTTVAGNVDAGIYDETGALLTSSGPIAQSGANAIQKVTVSPVNLAQGRYWIAMSGNGTTHTIYGRNSPDNAYYGIAQSYFQVTAFPLPATVTLGTPSFGYPFFGVVETGYPIYS